MAGKDQQQIDFERGGKQAAEKKAADTNASVAATANTKINKGLGDLIEKTGKSGTGAVTAIGEPQRSSFPAGLVGQSEYNRALTAWKSKSKTVSAPKAVGGGR